MNADDGHYGAHLAAEVLALREFRGLSTPGDYSVLARVGDAALAYRSHCWDHDPRT